MKISGCTMSIVLITIALSITESLAQNNSTAYLPADFESELPKVQANNNKVAAGRRVQGVHKIHLELTWSDFRPETPDRPGLMVWAFNEKGKLPQIPAPLIRVEENDQVRITFTNSHPDSVITLYGMATRPSTTESLVDVLPGETKTLQFEAGVPGTYLYSAAIGSFNSETEREQLTGAFIIDPKGYDQEDEVIVMNIYSTEYDSTYEFEFLEALTMNGKSWPFSDTFRPNVGDTLNWKIVNATRRGHPMHLHGFFYDINAVGGTFSSQTYEKEEVRTVVTEVMRRWTTMDIQWVPSRTGSWLFHCHLNFHVSPEIRLPGAEKKDEHHQHMAGLVIGVEVNPGSTDLISNGEVRNVEIIAKEIKNNSAHSMGFDLVSDIDDEPVMESLPSPLLVFNQYQIAEVTVTNTMEEATGIHWHGLELDSWADGVPGYSKSDGKVSPVINPGESFTYKLSLMRPGTFMYHSHLNDIHQITSGLYGPLLVLPEGEKYNPENDHVYILQWRTQNPRSVEDVELNGIAFTEEQKPMEVKVGERHRLRMINIAPAGGIFMEMLKDTVSIPLQAWAKDGADLQEAQRIWVERSPRYGVGETADFIFEPKEAGTYTLLIGNNRRKSSQTWTVYE